MSSFFVRLVLEMRFVEKSEWFTDKELVGKLVDTVLATDLAKIFTHAGEEYEEKPAKDVAALRKALVSGENGEFDAIDGPGRNDARSHAVFAYKPLAFRLSIRVGGDALTSRRRTVVDTLDTIAQQVIALMRARGGVDNGKIYVGDDDGELTYPHPRPPITVDWGTMTQIAQYIDVRYHNDPRLKGQPAIINAVAKGATPAGVKRRDQDDLIILRWIDSLESLADVGKALGRYELWLATVLPTKPAIGYNALGDLEVTPGDRAKKAPWTIYDQDEKVAYKAIMVSPDGEVDDDVWAEVVEAMKAGGKAKLTVRLIVPLRELALLIRERARKAGFDAVLYPDDEKRLWNPDPPGEWIEDIKPTPGGLPTSAEGSVKQRNRKKP